MLQFIFIGLIVVLIGYAISCIVYIGKGIKKTGKWNWEETIWFFFSCLLMFVCADFYKICDFYGI